MTALPVQQKSRTSLRLVDPDTSTLRETSTRTTDLPDAPDDVERDSYLRDAHRWVPFASAFGGFITTLSLLFLVRSQVWAIPLLVPLAISTLGMVLSLVSTSRPRRDTLESHRHKVASWEPLDYPSVDVFLPSAGEDLEVLNNTFAHVNDMEWQGTLTVYVLDDSARPEVQTLAEDYGFEYRTRPDRGVLKKAGNLRYGFTQSTGDWIAIFDADFVPRPDYLYEVLPYGDEEDVAIIQTPQYFDVDPAMNWVQHAAGATQILFYRWIQATRDRSDAAICVGTCATYRRSALNESGGFAQIGHSEDVHTGVNLMKVGYRVRYVPTVVSKGLCPDTLAQFATQQYRWCTGSMSLLMSRKFHAAPLTRRQRLCFWSGFLYYIDTAISVYLIAIPPILMALLAPDAVTVNNYLFVFLALVIRASVVPVITMGTESLPGLTRIQTAYSFAHSLALFDVLRGRTDSWQATGVKGGNTTARRLRRTMTIWLVTIQLVMWISCVWRAAEYGWIDYLPMAMFAALNLFVTYPLMMWRTDFPVAADPMSLRRRFSGSLT
ncbi:MAG: cellulose synthase catalytic subunit [Rhodococcus sp. (in: high G+C Gram-positive bacteria)]